LGDGLYLNIDPCYVFTADGQAPLKGKSVTTLASKWGGKERNAAILRHIVFWARTLVRHKQPIKIGTGASPIIVSGVPALVQTAFGIENDRLEVRSLLTLVDYALRPGDRGKARVLNGGLSKVIGAFPVPPSSDERERNDDPGHRDEVTGTTALCRPRLTSIIAIRRRSLIVTTLRPIKKFW
jgi:hypothetical protein